MPPREETRPTDTNLVVSLIFLISSTGQRPLEEGHMALNVRNCTPKHVARLELEPRMGRSIRRQFREYIYHNLIERRNGVWKDGGSPDDEGVVAWIREPENWLHRNNSHEVYAAMADHLGIKLTHENKRKMTKIIREALIADYEDNPDECYEWIVQLGLKVDELDIFEYQPWLHRVAQPLEALPSTPLPRQAT